MFCIGYCYPGSGNQNLSKADLIVERFCDVKLYNIFSEHYKNIIFNNVE